jgi:hypothetical protein
MEGVEGNPLYGNDMGEYVQAMLEEGVPLKICHKH